MKKILILEDEENIRSFVVINLERSGYFVLEAENGQQALTLLRENPDIGVAILDIMLPDIDGFEVCRRIRAGNKQIGILMLTARTQEEDKITGLMTGADDYVSKPFSPAELVARVDALYRRVGKNINTGAEVLRHGPFVLNLKNRVLERNGKRIRLTQVEYSMLLLFMRSPGQALSREHILRTVWGPEYNGDVKIVDVNVRRLRMKLEDDATKPVYISTVWGFGYKWGA
jgi:DNA-binding response OmpR family regulator